MKKLKANKKILNKIILFLIVIVTSVGTVFAERIIASSTVTYSNNSSGLSSTNVQGAIDELYNIYDKYVPSFSKDLKALPASDTVIKDDGTADHNMRYMGKSPNNYVTFNGELWRVIGVFNVDDGTGTKAPRVKIIKAESIGNKQWHSSDVNIWKSAQLNTDLQALSYASNSMVDNAVWHLGDPGESYAYTAAQAYEKERGTTVASGNDSTWTGKVGLMYPSDYGFASSTCKDGAKTIDSYSGSSPDCIGTDWLFLGSSEWLLSPSSSFAPRARMVFGGGWVSDNYASSALAVRPVVYLKPSVTCKNCNDSSAGTQSNPFQIELPA